MCQYFSVVKIQSFSIFFIFIRRHFNFNMDTETDLNPLEDYGEYYNYDSYQNYDIDDGSGKNFTFDINCTHFEKFYKEHHKNLVGLSELNTEEIFTASAYVVLALVGIVCNGLVGEILKLYFFTLVLVCIKNLFKFKK